MKPYSDATAAIDVRAWIKNRMQKYEEEPRTGVPRGEELPVPKHKYQAAHLMLLYGSQEYPDLHKIAKEAGTTYSLLGKWRTEPKFKAIIEKAAQEFTKEWLELYVWASDDREISNDHKEKATRKELVGTMGLLCQTTWGLALQDRITRLVGERLEKKSLSFVETMILESLLTTMLWPRLNEKRKNIVRQQYRQLSEQMITRLKKAGLEAVKTGNTSQAASIIEEMAKMLAQESKSKWQVPSKKKRA